jgi:hypothetical protein
MQEGSIKMESIFDMATKDQILINMGTAIGRIDGTLTAWSERLEEHNERLSQLLEKQDERLSSVEDEIKGAKNKAIGFGIGAGAAGGGVIAAVMKLFH